MVVNWFLLHPRDDIKSFVSDEFWVGCVLIAFWEKQLGQGPELASIEEIHYVSEIEKFKLNFLYSGHILMQICM